MEKLQGKIAVVTAATKGIGLASAEILAKWSNCVLSSSFRRIS